MQWSITGCQKKPFGHTGVADEEPVGVLPPPSVVDLGKQVSVPGSKA
jgi:hypothetical protein